MTEILPMRHNTIFYQSFNTCIFLMLTETLMWVIFVWISVIIFNKSTFWLSLQDLDAKILQTASQKQIMNDKKRREAFKKILSDVIGVIGILFLFSVPFSLNEFALINCFGDLSIQYSDSVLHWSYLPKALEKTWFFKKKMNIQCNWLWEVMRLWYISLQKNIGQQFKRESQYRDLPPIFRIKPPKSTNVLEEREGASGLCELFTPTDDWKQEMTPSVCSADYICWDHVFENFNGF